MTVIIYFQLETLINRERELLLCNVKEAGLDLLRKRQLPPLLDIILTDATEDDDKKSTLFNIH